MDDQKASINALKIGGQLSNPRIKYALVVQNPEIGAQLTSAVANGELLHQADTFDTFEKASDWAGL